MRECCYGFAELFQPVVNGNNDGNWAGVSFWIATLKAR